MISERKIIMIILGALFLLGAALHFVLPFDKGNWLFEGMHYLDAEILKNNLFSGLFFLHSQPPLFNFFLGIVLKAAPLGLGKNVFELIYLFIEAGLIMGIYYFLRTLKAPVFLAAIGAFLAILSPPFLMVWRWLWYGLPLAFLMVWSAIFLCRFFESSKFRFFVGFSLFLSMIVLMRSFFNLFVWMLPILAVVLLIVKKNKSFLFGRCLVAAFLFFVLAAVPYFKNYLLFDHFSVSAWDGMNLAKTVHFAGNADIEKMIASGKITSISLIPPFSAPEKYYDYFGISQSEIKNKAVDALYKIGGGINYNNSIYIKASDEYRKNSLMVIKEYPLRYLESVLNEVYIFFSFGSGRLFDGFLKEWGFIRTDVWHHTLRDLADYYLVPLCFFLVFAVIIIYLIRFLLSGIDRLKNGAAGQDFSFFTVYLYVLFNIAYVFVVSVFFELGESNLMRIPIDPFFLVFSVFIIYNAFQRFFLYRRLN